MSGRDHQLGIHLETQKRSRGPRWGNDRSREVKVKRFDIRLNLRRVQESGR